MHDNAPSHASKETRAFLQANGFSGKKLLDWPASSLDIKPIENLWSILKNQMDSDGRQFSSNKQLWAKKSDVCAGITQSAKRKLTKSADKRLIELLNNGGDYVHHLSLSLIKFLKLHGVFLNLHKKLIQQFL